jgi:pyrimidine-nucleoside phosphorylase
LIPYQIIRRKRDGLELSPAELTSFFDAYAAGSMQDYQMAAFLMAVFFRGLSRAEITALVDVIIRSGVTLDFSRLSGPKIDKHSTGGVGDKVSIILAPLMASMGIRVPMMTGRGLGHTGGTSDKLESIPGLRTELSLDEFQRQVERIGCAFLTQTDQITPLDKKLYALRDVTGTVESIPLIASSIMSKKIAEGVDGLLLDVKRGNGAFLPRLEDAIDLARTMISIGAAYDRKVVALLTAMDRPLGYAIGNALEVEEAILTLRGEGPPDLRELTIRQAVEMLLLASPTHPAAARGLAESTLTNGEALERLRRVIEAQDGNPAVVDDPALLPQAPVRKVIEAARSGTVGSMDVRRIGDAAVALGAGRASLASVIDHAVGFHITVKPGDRVEPGQPIATVLARTEQSAQVAARSLQEAIRIGEQPADPLPLVSHRITIDGVEELPR